MSSMATRCSPSAEGVGNSRKGRLLGWLQKIFIGTCTIAAWNSISKSRLRMFLRGCSGRCAGRYKASRCPCFRLSISFLGRRSTRRRISQALFFVRRTSSSFIAMYSPGVTTFTSGKNFVCALPKTGEHDLAIGVATYLITSVWGDFAPQALTSWTVDQLPPPNPALAGPLWSSRHLSGPSWKQTVSAVATRVGDRGRHISWIVETFIDIFQPASGSDSSYSGRNSLDANCPLSRADSFSHLSRAFSLAGRTSLYSRIASLAPTEE